MDQQPTKPNGVGDLMTAFGQWWSGAARNARVGVGCGALALALAICVLGGIIGSQQGGSANAAAQANTTSSQQHTSTPAKKATPAPTPKPKTWHTIASYSGSNNTQTPTISIPDGARIVWTYTPTDTQYGNLIDISLYDASANLPVDDIANTANAASGDSGTYTVHGDGHYYFNVSTDSMNWTIQVQVYS